jgi:hypothetical protein
MDAGVWDPRGGAAREVFHNSVDGDVMDVGMEGVAADGWWAGLESLGYYLHSGMERIMWMGWVIVVERQDCSGFGRGVICVAWGTGCREMSLGLW